MPISGVSIGHKVRIYSDYGRKHHDGTVAESNDWETKLEDGTIYRNFEFRRGLSIVNLESQEYRDAVDKHDADVAIAILRGSDAVKHPEISKLLNACAEILGKEEVSRRSSMLKGMGALKSLDNDIYENASIKNE